MVKFAQPTEFEILKKQRGNRVRVLRTALQLSRRAFAEKYGLPRGTLQNWEDGRYGGLTERGAMQLIEIMQQENLYCSVEWLLHGVGEAPPLINATYTLTPTEPARINDAAIAKYTYQETAFMNEELSVFRRHYHPHVLELWVPDDDMLPHYQAGDLIAGRKRYDKSIATLAGQICLVQLADGRILLRELQLSQFANGYQVRTSTQAKQSAQEVELIAAAAISWWRRKDMLDF